MNRYIEQEELSLLHTFFLLASVSIFIFFHLFAFLFLLEKQSLSSQVGATL